MPCFPPPCNVSIHNCPARIAWPGTSHGSTSQNKWNSYLNHLKRHLKDWACWREVTDLEKIIHSTARCRSQFLLENNRPLLRIFLKKPCDQLPVVNVHVVIKCANVQQSLLKKAAVYLLFMVFLLSVMQITLFFTFPRGVFSLPTQTYPLAYAPTPRTDIHRACFLHAVQISALINQTSYNELFSQYFLLLSSLRTCGYLFSKVTLFPFFLLTALADFHLFSNPTGKKLLAKNNLVSGFLF